MTIFERITKSPEALAEFLSEEFESEMAGVCDRCSDEECDAENMCMSGALALLTTEVEDDANTD